MILRFLYYVAWYIEASGNPTTNGIRGRKGTTDFSVIRTVGREGVCVARCTILEWVSRRVNCYDLYIYHMQISDYFQTILLVYDRLKNT